MNAAQRKYKFRKTELQDRINRRREKLSTVIAVGPAAYGNEAVYRQVISSHELAVRRMEMMIDALEEGALQ